VTMKLPPRSKMRQEGEPLDPPTQGSPVPKSKKTAPKPKAAPRPKPKAKSTHTEPHFPDWLEAYCDMNDSLEAPRYIHRWVGLFTFAAALERRVFIDEGVFHWTPNLYVLLLGPSGVSKSTSISPGKRILRDVGVPMGASDTTYEALVANLARNKTRLPLPHNDEYQYSALAACVSEMGTLFGKDEERKYNTYIDFWDSEEGPWEKHRISGNANVHTPSLSLITGTTPPWLRGNMSPSILNGGFFARFIVVHMHSREKHRAYPSDFLSSEAGATMHSKLVEDLTLVREQFVGKMTLTEDAKAWGRIWYDQLILASKVRGEVELVAGSLNRRQQMAHKLAITLNLARGRGMVITKETLIEASDLLKAVEKDLPTALGDVLHNSTQNQEIVVKYIANVDTNQEGKTSVLRSRLVTVLRKITDLDVTQIGSLLDEMLANGLINTVSDPKKEFVLSHRLRFVLGPETKPQDKLHDLKFQKTMRGL